MAGRLKIPTTQQIESLYESGNISALTDLNETLAKAANTRLGRLEKADLDNTAAYKRASYYLGEVSDFSQGNRFSRSKKMDIDDLYEQLKEESKFLRSQTSTISGEKSRRDKIFESLTEGRNGKEPAVKIPEGANVDEFKDKFLAFLDDDYWKEIKKNIYTKNILNEAGEAIAAGASLDDLKAALDDYMEKDIGDIDSIWLDWISVGDKI